MPGKTIKEIEWSSFGGRVEYRLVYTDGTVSPIRPTDVETSETFRFRVLKARTETEYGFQQAA